MYRIAFIALALSLGCGGPQQNDATASGPPPPVGPSATPLAPTEGGDAVRMQKVTLSDGEAVAVSNAVGQETFFFVESGSLDRYAAGSAVHLRGDHELTARGETTVIALVATTPGASDAEDERTISSATLEGTPVLPNAGGKLRVQIFHDVRGGASVGAFSLLDADADLSVPEHVHETSVEALYILSGDGTMILGEERSPVEPGRVIYIPANTNHGYEAGTEPLRALQIYAPPGPEQRFRGE